MENPPKFTHNVRLVIEYDGSAFVGFQSQPGLKTVQSELSRVLTTYFKKPIGSIHTSGRTDAGVHAKRQVISFYTDEVPDLFRMHHAVSSMMKGELSVVRADMVPMSYHPRKSAHKKQYTYRILNRPAPPTFQKGAVLHFVRKLDVEIMQREIAKIIGKHDFTSFCAGDCCSPTKVREILEADITQQGEEIFIRIVGNGFLKQMVRIIVGTLLEIGIGHRTEGIEELLSKKDRRLAGKTAPAYGLYLDWVESKEGERL